MNKEQQKQQAAQAALQYIKNISIIGIGSGSTVNYFIDELAKIKHNIEGVVAASSFSEQKLKQYGIPVLDLNNVYPLEIYVDGADEINEHKQMIKGGGGALTREKIIASAAEKFICIVDSSKKVKILGEFPIAVEVIPMARSYVAREIVKLGGNPVYRQGFVTDNGNVILDVWNLKLLEPIKMEQTLNNIAGVVANGIFALRPADVFISG